MKLSLLTLTFVSLLLVTSCSNNSPIEEELPSNPENQNIFLVYYSATGNTERVINIIGEHLNIVPHVLEPVDPYTTEDLRYSDSSSRVSQERNDPSHLTPLVTTSFEGFNESSLIILGFPIWWGNPSWVVNEFIINNDFSSKTIATFGTSSSSRYSNNNLIELANNEGEWLEEQRFSSRVNEEEVISWIDSII